MHEKSRDQISVFSDIKHGVTELYQMLCR